METNSIKGIQTQVASNADCFWTSWETFEQRVFSSEFFFGKLSFNLDRYRRRRRRCRRKVDKNWDQKMQF